MILAMTNAGVSYGPHKLGVFGSSSANVERLVHFHEGVMYTFGLQDHGDRVTMAYELSGSPLLLKEGDLIPPESFGPEEQTVTIWESLTHGMEFSDGDADSGVPRTSGTHVFPTEFTEARTAVPTRLYDIGYVTFTHKEFFNVSRNYTLVGIVDANSRPKPDRTVTGSFLLGLPIVKTMFSGNHSRKVSASEAWGLNYYGGSAYGSSCYDLDTGILYAGTGNAYSVPRSDSVAARKANSANSTEDISLDAIFVNYSALMSQ